METNISEQKVPDENQTDSKSNSDVFNLNQISDSLKVDETKILNTSEDNNDEFYDAVEENEQEELDLDDEELENRFKNLSEEELMNLKKEAASLKSSGNDSFKVSKYEEAVSFYTQALNTCPLKYQNDRSILYANRAAARIGLENKDDALLDCNKAIELNPDYLRAILRRAQLHRKMDNLDRCLEDYKKVLELDRNNMEARQACTTLPDEINARNEKLKEEMFGKLKELGNVCLKPFGLSTENFKMVQNPETGGYSINFQK